ncbi:MAG: SIS domain-containing protein [Deltaproteobacteria bacterium]|nr:SIS domain-containing protein [Deltaproteobacteria bacterium]
MDANTAFSRSYLQSLKEVLDSFDHEAFERMIKALLDAREKGATIFVMGNGGSASTASHWVCDINKGCSGGDHDRFRMMCLNDSISTMLAYANDVSYADVFVEQLKNFFEPGDVVIGISGSGNSENVLRAVAWARENGGTTVGLSGFSGGRLATIVDIPLVARVHDMQKTEDVHMIVVHMVMQRLQGLLGLAG